MNDEATKLTCTSISPLITFALFSYNQESYIRQAMMAALDQTHQPLEIIVSDDCSSDNTYDVICDLAKKYNGPHKLIITRNESNLGIGSHINKICRMARGELIVASAGDDVSASNRTSEIANAWMGSGRKHFSICSDAVIIDSNGNEKELMNGEPFRGRLADGILNSFSGLHGATHAWHADVFRIFGELLPETVCEDRVIALRSCLLGGFAYINKTLVQYRVHGGNISHHFAVANDDIIKRTISIHKRNSNVYKNYLADLNTAKEIALITVEDHINCTSLALGLKNKIDDKIRFLEGGVGSKLVLIARYLLKDPLQALRWFIVLLAPTLYKNNQARNFGVRV